MSYLTGVIATWWYYGLLGRLGRCSKLNLTLLDWFFLPSGWPFPFQPFLGEIQNDHSMVAIKGCLKLFFLSAFVEGQRGLNSNNLIQFWLVLVEASQLVWSCRLAAELLLINTQRLPSGYPYTVAGLGFTKITPETSVQAPGCKPRHREPRRRKKMLFSG